MMKNSFCHQWKISDVLEGHQGAVNSVAGINISLSKKEESRTVIASASADSTIKIWDRKGTGGTQLWTP